MNFLQVFVSLLSVVMLLSGTARAEEAIRISVPASMTDVMRELAAQFGATGKYPPVIPNFGPSGTLAKQIVEGAPVDLFISANQKWMTYLRDEKRIDPASEKIIAANTLVFMGKANPGITRLNDLVKLKQIALGSPKSVPAGEYAVQAMEKAGVYNQLEEGQKLIMAKDVRQSLTYAERGEADGAFVYATDARLAVQAVILFTVPQELYDRITYPLALTIEGAGNAGAKAFYAYLLSPEAASLFKKYGFSAAP